MKPRTAAICGLAIMVGLTAEMVFRISQIKPTPAPPVPEQTIAPVAPTAPSTPVPKAPATQPVSPLQTRIEEFLEKLLSGTASAEQLNQLERELMEADPKEAIAAISEFLKTGRDAATGSDFQVGEKGQLTAAPTLRVALMDVLGRLTRKTGGPEAATLARSVLAAKSSADEWAISLRNLAWHEPHATQYLASKTREMLSYAPWLSAPSSGMLEAFDLAVFTKDPTLIPTLASMVNGESRALQRAAAVALDRFSEAAPLQVMNYLNSNPQLMAERPFVRADYFSKADLADLTQKQAVEVYLSRADVSREEKTKFLKGLATPASFVSENLLTAPSVPVDDDSSRAKVISTVLQEWLTTPRFPELRGEFQTLQSRMLLEAEAQP